MTARIPVVAVALPLALLVGVAYAPLAPWLWERWRAPDGFFSHGPLVPLACGWLVWQRRREIAARAADAAGDWRGLLLLVPALLLLVAATFARVDSIAAASLLLLLPGLVWLLAGLPALRTLAAPLAFLVFALPWPMELMANVVQSLKLFVVAASGVLVNLFGAGVQAEGSFLLLPSGDRLLVDDECSGLKSALALLALGTFMALSARDLSRRQRLLLVVIALPVALAANVLRVALLAAVGIAGGAERARGWHDPSTWGIYVVALLAYLGIERWMRRRSEARR